MNFSKTLTVLILFVRPLSRSLQYVKKHQDYRGVDQLNILKLIVESDVWRNNVGTRNVLSKGKIMALNNCTIEIPMENIIGNTDGGGTKKSKNQTANWGNVITTLMYKLSKLTYTALKCKYADLIIETLGCFVKINDVCQTLTAVNNGPKPPQPRAEKCLDDAFDYLISLKRHIIKMMHNLFIFEDTFPNLKFADQTLLKSLMVVNSFLDYRSDNYYKPDDSRSSVMTPGRRPSITIMRNVLTQLINLVERFRCKKCLHDYPYFLRRDDGIAKTISEYDDNDDFYAPIHKVFFRTSEQLELYFNEIDVQSFCAKHKNSGPETDAVGYNDEMYDKKNVLLGFIFDDDGGKSKKCYSSFFGALTVNLGNNNAEARLHDVYSNAVDGYDLKTMFDYQLLLMAVIDQLFSVRFLQFKDPNDHKYTLEALIQLTDDYNTFISEVLPHNYPVNRKNAMKRLSSIINNDIKSYLLKFMRVQVLTDRTLDEHRTNVTTIRNWESNSFLNALEKISFYRLISYIVGHKYFDGYLRVFRLFLSEPTTFGGYRVYNENDHRKLNESNAAKHVCTPAFKLRESLLLFHTLMVSDVYKQSDDANFAVLTAIDGINESLANAYQTYGRKNGEIKAILVSVSMRFKNANIVDDYNGIMLVQHAMLTANLLEHFEINNCATVRFNDQMYTALLADHGGLFVRDLDGVVVGVDDKYLTQKIADLQDLPLHRSLDESSSTALLWWADRYFPGDIFMFYNSTLNTNKINWDGTEVRIEDVLLTVNGRDIVDYDQLVRFQLVRLKWSVYNVFKTMLYVADNRRAYPINDLSTIKNDLLKILTVSFPKPIQEYLQLIFAEYIIAVFDESIDNDGKSGQINDCISMIREQLRYLDVIADDDYNNVNYNSKIFENDVECPRSTVIIPLDRIHNDLLNECEFLTVILMPSDNYQILLVSPNDFFYIY